MAENYSIMSSSPDKISPLSDSANYPQKITDSSSAENSKETSPLSKYKTIKVAPIGSGTLTESGLVIDYPEPEKTIAEKEDKLTDTAATESLSSSGGTQTQKSQTTQTLSEQLKSAQTGNASSIDSATNLPKAGFSTSNNIVISTPTRSRDFSSYKYLTEEQILNTEKQLGSKLTDEQLSAWNTQIADAKKYLEQADTYKYSEIPQTPYKTNEGQGTVADFLKAAGIEVPAEWQDSAEHQAEVAKQKEEDISALIQGYTAAGLDIPKELQTMYGLADEQAKTGNNVTDVGTGTDIPLFSEQLAKRAAGEDYVVYYDQDSGQYSLVSQAEADEKALEAQQAFIEKEASKEKQIEYDYDILDKSGNVVSVKAPTMPELTEETLAALPSEDLNIDEWIAGLQEATSGYDINKLSEYLTNNDPTTYASALALRKANEIGTDYFGYVSLNRYYQAQVLNKLYEAIGNAYDFSKVAGMSTKEVDASGKTLAAQINESLAGATTEEASTYQKIADYLKKTATSPSTYSNLMNLAAFGKGTSAMLGGLSSLGSLSGLLGTNQETQDALNIGGGIASLAAQSELAASAGAGAIGGAASFVPVLGLAAMFPTLAATIGGGNKNVVTQDDIDYLKSDEGQTLSALYYLMYNPSEQYKDLTNYELEYLNDWTNGQYTGEMSKINWADQSDANAVDFSDVFGYNSGARAYVGGDYNPDNIALPEMYWKNLGDYALQRKRSVYRA